MSDYPNVTSPREVAFLMKQYGLQANKQLGQHFLIDSHIVDKILDAAAVERSDNLVEIGPGLGALTLAMGKRGARVLALELDSGLCELLRDLCRPFSNIRVLQGDALQTDWFLLKENNFPLEAKVKLVANLPYYISSPLMYSLMENRFPFYKAVMMFQKEVGMRVTAGPGTPDYGSLSVLCSYYTESRISFKVSRHVFWPSPGVDSAVVVMEPRLKRLPVGDSVLFHRLVKGVFQKRRKTILNGLLFTFKQERSMLEYVLREAGIDPSRRPETVTVEEFANLCRFLYNKIN